MVFFSNEEMSAHPEVMAEAEVLNIHPYMLTKEFLHMCPKLKWIQTPAAGVDGACMEEIKRRGILFTNGTGNMSVSIAEDVFCKMLMHSRRMREYDEAKRRRQWLTFDQDPWMAVVARDLYGKRLGLIGDGAIATEIAKRAKAFEMEVLTYGLYNGKCPYWDTFYDTDEGLKCLLKESDFVVIVVPLTASTRYMMNTKTFALMKSSAMLLNAARGSIVKEDDLIHALEGGEIAAAALDVFEVEPLPESSKLWEMPNVYITTHKAGAGDSWVKRLKKLYEDNVEAYAQGRPLRNQVSL
ncbi:MAG TPA: D-2-hydroxyacid dehydrogenase [Candidatus Mediterraneibacter intestinavium]|nr:D-2-hydroxyacid dehydrogenase [Candidatus Mediterraneibacter intestinavium]